jgi:hypothetical protein
MDLEKSFEKLNIQEHVLCQENTFCVLSIDIGVINLGISVSSVDSDFNFIEVIWIDLINITELKHRAVCKDDCKLQHTRTFSDWLDHVYQDNQYFFDNADFIIIEKQPPMGFVVVEQLIFNKYRDKASLINPINVHTFLNMSNLDYDGRKAKSEKIALPMITDVDLCRQITFYHRRHDICDSLCMLLYWLHKKRQELEKQQRIYKASQIVIDNINIDDWLDKKRYNPN